MRGEVDDCLCCLVIVSYSSETRPGKQKKGDYGIRLVHLKTSRFLTVAAGLMPHPLRCHEHEVK